MAGPSGPAEPIRHRAAPHRRRGRAGEVDREAERTAVLERILASKPAILHSTCREGAPWRGGGRLPPVVESGCMPIPEVDSQFWNNAAQSAIAGVFAAVVAAILLELARSVRRWFGRRRDVKYVRDLLIEGRKHVLVDAKDFYHEGMQAHCSADVYRAALYNNMVKKLEVGLGKWTPNLSHTQRKGLLDALDWYHKNLHMTKDKRKELVFAELRDGVWPARELKLERATEIFDRLQSVRWLNLPPVH